MEAMTYCTRFTLITLAAIWALSGCRSAGPPNTLPGNSGALENGETLAFSHSALTLELPNIYLLDVEHGLRVIARSDQYDTGPLWSPDGSRLLYQQSLGWKADYFLFDAETWEPRQLTRDGFYKYSPRWSPDGKHLAYLTVNEPGAPNRKPDFLNILDVPSGESRIIPFERVLDYRWRPDSKTVFIVTLAGGFTMSEEVFLDGSRRLLDGKLDFLNGAKVVSLSPDASLVAYAVPDPNPDSLVDPLYIAAIDSSGERNIGGFATDSSLAWSPDSASMALVTLAEDYRYALFVGSADGSGLKKLLALDTADESGEILPGTPAWSSDSRKIAIGSFSSPVGAAIFILNADGSEIRQVTEPGGLIFDIFWRP